MPLSLRTPCWEEIAQACTHNRCDFYSFEILNLVNSDSFREEASAVSQTTVGHKRESRAVELSLATEVKGEDQAQMGKPQDSRRPVTGSH